MSGPRKKRGPATTALQAVELQLKYHAVTFLAKTFEKPFWFWEQRRSQLQDRIANKRDENR
jgi:hypothetical protein